MPKKTTVSSVIESGAEGTRLVDFLSSRFKYHSTETWTELILNGDVQVNGAAASTGHRLKRGDVVSYCLVLTEPPVDPGIRILHNEEAFLVAYKPGNLPSHANGRYLQHTFIYLLKKHLSREGYHGYATLAHRLDRETSGLLIVAKSKAANRALARQFGAGEVEKEYLAIVRGTVSGDCLALDGPIAPDPDSVVTIRRRVVPAGTPDARSAFTRFEVVERIAGYSLLRCLPATGRTNQIRVHLDHIGHPLAGDKLYGRSDAEFLQYVQSVRAGHFDPLPWMDARRHMLHASSIGFRHPLTGRPVRFHCPMPRDMTDFWRAGPDNH